jgi:glycosyltransferase involved in cell wall biosynthesis
MSSELRPGDPSGEPLGDGRQSICYVVPFYSDADDQHFAHMTRFLTELAKLCDLYVIVERGKVTPDIPGACRVMAQQVDPDRRVRRYLEFLSLVREVRMRGCRRFFVRISKGAALALLMASPFLGTEVYYWVSGDVQRALLGGKPLVSRRRLIRGDVLTRLVVRHAHRLVTGPESMVDYYVEEYGISPSRCVVLYNDIDLSVFSPATAEEAESMRDTLGLERGMVHALFGGRLSFLKGGDFLPAIAEQLGTTKVPVKIVAVGRVPNSELGQHLETHPAIQLVGPRPNKDVLSYLRACDMLILPSRAEGFPRVLIEAMACGLPAVVFAAGGVRDILGPLQQRFVVPVGDIDSFASLIAELAEHPDLRRTLGAENLEAVQRFSTERVAEMFAKRILS